MAEGSGAKIESVYEAGFGSMGKPEDNVMFENSIGVFKLSEKNKKGYQEYLDNNGWDSSPRDIIFFAEKGGIAQRDKAEIALSHATVWQMKNPDFPKVVDIKSTGENTFQKKEVNPAQVLSFTDKYVHTNRESSKDIELPLSNIVFCQANGASDAEYQKARRMLINEANKALQIFEADFRIPQFPPDEDLKSI